MVCLASVQTDDRKEEAFRSVHAKQQQPQQQGTLWSPSHRFDDASLTILKAEEASPASLPKREPNLVGFAAQLPCSSSSSVPIANNKNSRGSSSFSLNISGSSPTQAREESHRSSSTSSSSATKARLKHSSTLTDLAAIPDSCAEVELVSLIQEQTQPLYKLRADSLTQFSGYENQDWYISAPALPADTPVDLSPEAIKETLDFLVLSGERLSQMTRTYNDIDAVTRLLEEKERDLELAARIGQSLLEQNKCLKSRNEELEGDLISCNESIERLSFDFLNTSDRVTQLQHDLSVKNGLLQIYSADLESNEFESSQQLHHQSPSHANRGVSARDRAALILGWDDLHEKVCNLEDENNKLRTDANSRLADIEDVERKELMLIHDCAKQLTDANGQLLSLQEELARRSDDNIRQQEEITNLLTQVVELQRKVRDLSVDNDGYHSALSISRECQSELSAELLDLKEKYGTLLAAFHELQEELKRRQRLSVSQWPPSFMPINSESLAAEIESVLESEGYDSSEYSSLNIHRLPNRDGGCDTRCHTPDSLLSHSAGFGGGGGRGPLMKCSLPAHTTVAGLLQSHGNSATRSLLGSEKLKIVKSFEGSETLNKWRKLATPNFGALLEPTMGSIQSKALKDLNTELLHYVLNSSKQKQERENSSEPHSSQFFVAEDKLLVLTGAEPKNGEAVSPGSPEEQRFEPHPGKVFDSTSSTFTYTTTCLSQSTDSTMVTPSFSSVQLSTRHQTPITSACTVTSTTFSTMTQPSLSKITTNMSQGFSSQQQELLTPGLGPDEKLGPKTPAPSPIDPPLAGHGLGSINFANFGPLWGQSLRRQQAVKSSGYVKYLPIFDSASNSNEATATLAITTEEVDGNAQPLKNEEEDEKVDKNRQSGGSGAFSESRGLPSSSRSSSSALKNSPAMRQVLSPSTSIQGLAAMADLTSEVSSCGVVTKGHDATFSRLSARTGVFSGDQRPKSLILGKKSRLASARDSSCFVGVVSAMKTLRKGGFV